MTENERIRELRKTLNLTQVEFGERICMSQGHLTSIETGARSVTDKLVKMICMEFGVNETWLLSGEGNMFDDASDTIDSISKQLNLNAFQTRLLRLIHDLTPEQQILVQQMAHQLAGDEPPEESDRDRTARIARAALADYDRQQEEEVQDKRA